MCYYICPVNNAANYSYVVNSLTSNPIFLINKHIGHDKDLGYGIIGAQFAKEFIEIDNSNPERISTLINCFGGSVTDGYDIFSSISNAKSQTETTFIGFAFSTAGWCGLSADVVNAYDYCTWMCHLPYNQNDPEKKSDFLDSVANSISLIISEKSGKNGKKKLSAGDVLNLMQSKTYYTAYQLYDMGLIDNVLKSTNSEKTKYLSIKNFNDGDTPFNEEKIPEQYKEYQEVVNTYVESLLDDKDKEIKNINNNKNVIKMKEYQEVINYLKLNPESGVSSIVEEIARRDNKYNALNSEFASLKTEKEELASKLSDAQAKQSDIQNQLIAKDAEKETLNAQLNTVNTELQSLKDQLKAIEDEKATNILKEKEAKASETLQKFIDAGIVKNEEKVVNIWKQKFVDDYDGTLVLLEAMEASPVNFKAPNLGTEIHNKIEDIKEGSFEWWEAQNKKEVEEREKQMEEDLKKLYVSH